jgi:hypothetical protein
MKSRKKVIIKEEEMREIKFRGKAVETNEWV